MNVRRESAKNCICKIFKCWIIQPKFYKSTYFFIRQLSYKHKNILTNLTKIKPFSPFTRIKVVKKVYYLEEKKKPRWTKHKLKQVPGKRHLDAEEELTLVQHSAEGQFPWTGRAGPLKRNLLPAVETKPFLSMPPTQHSNEVSCVLLLSNPGFVSNADALESSAVCPARRLPSSKSLCTFPQKYVTLW